MGKRTDSADSCVLPVPVVEWDTVVRAYRPTERATRQRLRLLRSKFGIRGMNVHLRDATGLRGSSTFFSVLVVFAAHAEREGDHEAAEQLSESARELEQRFGDQLKDYLARCPAEDLPRAAFFEELMSATIQGLLAWRAPQTGMTAAVVIDDFDGPIAHLEGNVTVGYASSVEVPRLLLEQADLGPHDRAWVFSSMLESVALVEVLPAIQVDCAGMLHVEHMAWLTGRDQHNDSPVGTDGMTKSEREQVADDFHAGVGSRMSPQEIAESKRAARAKGLPKRVIRLAG